MALIQEFLGLPSVGSVRSGRDGAVFFGSVAKDPDPTKHKSYGYLTAADRSPGRPISHVVQSFFGCGVAPRHRKIRSRLPFLASMFLHPTVRIGFMSISQRTTKEGSKLFFASIS
jgi:hypothetical protein